MFSKSRHIKSLTDEALMSLLGTDKANQALTELHARYAQRVLGYFIKMFSGDVDKAQDFVQDVFIRVLERHKQFDPSRKFYTWMFTIASNMCKTEFRKLPEQTFSEQEDQATWDEDLMTRELFRNELNRILNSLDEEHRSVFVMRHINQLSLKEIAEIKEIPLGTVKSRLFNATRKIAGQLGSFKNIGEDLFKMN